MTDYRIDLFPKSRIATNDVCAIGLRKHHVVALTEIDVTAGREKMKIYKKNHKGSFTAWLIQVISNTIGDYENVAAYLKGKRRLMLFKDVNVSLAVEKKIRDQKVPMPVIIEKANARSIESITQQINEARDLILTEKDIVLQNKSSRLELIYYHLPGFLRRYFWKYLLSHPKLAFGKMGNVAITSLGMMGKANGWFIPISVHPVCFGIGRVVKKPVVLNDQIVIREILNMTVLMDHDVIDGAQMARFISDLSVNIENGQGLEG